MKILHLLYESEGDYFGVGGVAVRAYEVYKRLKDRHDITLLCKRYSGANDGYINGLKHIYVGSESKSLRDSLLSYAYQSASYLRQNGHKYDIIVDEFSPAIPNFSHLFTKKPIILQIQGYTDYHYFRKYDPFSASFLYVSEKIRPIFYKNLILINENTLNRLLVRKYENILVLPNGINTDLLQSDYYLGDYILYLGRIDYYAKGLDLLIRAYVEVYKNYPHIKLMIVGDGRDRDLLAEKINMLPNEIQQNIITKGWLTGKEKLDVMNKAMFYILPSRHETQGITLLEAMASKKALLVSDINELDYAVRCGSAESFKCGSYKSLSEKMIEYISNSHTLIHKALKGYEWVKNYTWDEITKRYEDFLIKVASN